MAANFFDSTSCSALGRLSSLPPIPIMIAFVDPSHRPSAESNISDDTTMASNSEHSPYPV